MSLFEIFAVSIVVVVGIYVSYTDLKFGKIPNICTYGLVLFGLVCQAIFVYTGHTTLLNAIWLLFGGLIAGFLMYYLGVWAPGDSKLFWGICLALPPTMVGGYPPFILTANTFAPYFMVIAVYVLIKTSAGQKLHALREMLNPRFLLQLTLTFVGFMGLSSLIMRFLPITLDFFSSMVLFLILLSLLDRWLGRKKQLYFLVPLAIFAVVSAWQNLASFLEMLLITLGLFLVLRFFITSLSGSLFTRQVDVSKLKAGLIPVYPVVRNEEGHYVIHKVEYASLLSIASRPAGAEVVMDLYPEGLPAEKVAELQELGRQGAFASFDNKIEIQDKLPFAPIILFGAVVTVLCRGLFIIPLVSLFRG